MYFENRLSAAKELAIRLAKYTDDDAVVATLSESSEGLGEVIAKRLSIPLTTFISRAINLPGEKSSIGSVDQEGSFMFNTRFTQGQTNEYTAEYHNYIEEEKIKKSHEINRDITAKGLNSRNEFTDKIVILVSDGLNETVALDSAVEYLKPIRLKRLVMAVPVVSVMAVDRMHVACDEIHVLSVTENFISSDHYYDDTRER